MAFSVEQLIEVLSIMGKGMAGIFVVIGIIMASVMLLNRFTTLEKQA